MREQLRAKISRFYRGELHFAFTFSISGGATIWLASQARSPSWREWLAVPLFFLFCALIEYLEHRYLLHQRRFGELPFRLHTVEHHGFYTVENFKPESRRDYAYVLFPPAAVIGYFVLIAAPFTALGRLVSPNVGWLVGATAAAFFFLYEIVHFGAHLGWRLPVFQQLGEHHRIHHETELMTTRNFNVVCPIFDWLFGTLERSSR